MKRVYKISTLLAIAFALAGCFKDVVDYTSYNTAVYSQQESDGEITIAQNIEAYAFYVDTTEWRIASYEDAVAKIITNEKTAATKSEPAAEAVPYAADDEPADAEGRLKIKTNKQHVMLVAIYPAMEMWAYRHYEVGENLPTTTMKFHFRPWKTGEYVDSGWTFNRKPQPAEPEVGGDENTDNNQE